MMPSAWSAPATILEGTYLWARRAITAALVHRPRRRQLGIHEGDAPLFRTVFFELRTRCNSRCRFCAAAVPYESRPDATMPFPLYEKVVEELAGIGYRGQIAYHVNSEPLLVPDLERFVGLARARLPRAWIRIFTNGLALSRSKGEALLSAGLDELTVNWYTTADDVPLPRNLVIFRDEVLPRFHPRERVRPGTGPLRHGDRSIFRFNIHRRRIDEVLDSRAGSAPNKRARPEDATGFCENPFTQINITADGRVGRCCADFYFADVMGNVGSESLLEIWQGARFQAARRHLLRGNRSASALCGQCDFIGVSPPGIPLVAHVASSLLYRIDRLLRPPLEVAPAGRTLSSRETGRLTVVRR
jgi:iron-sulfur cluster protein/radical SAM family protein